MNLILNKPMTKSSLILLAKKYGKNLPERIKYKKPLHRDCYGEFYYDEEDNKRYI